MLMHFLIHAMYAEEPMKRVPNRNMTEIISMERVALSPSKWELSIRKLKKCPVSLRQIRVTRLKSRYDKETSTLVTAARGEISGKFFFFFFFFKFDYVSKHCKLAKSQFPPWRKQRNVFLFNFHYGWNLIWATEIHYIHYISRAIMVINFDH